MEGSNNIRKCNICGNPISNLLEVLPTYQDSENAVKGKYNTPINDFIIDFEPAGNSDSKSFRLHLLKLIFFVQKTQTNE